MDKIASDCIAIQYYFYDFKNYFNVYAGTSVILHTNIQHLASSGTIMAELLKKLRINKISLFLSTNCYELLLAALLLHLYGSIFFINLIFYGKYIRVLNTFLLYFSATNSLFHREGRVSLGAAASIAMTLLFNLILLQYNDLLLAREIRDILYFLFLLFTLYHTSAFIVSPHRFDKALILASACGYLLIIEIFVRIFILLYSQDNKQILSNIDFSYHTNTFIDTVYFCTVTITSIGFGDVLPINHNAKMAASLLGLTGQFYLVVVMGIMVSKFITGKQQKSADLKI